MRGCFRHFHGYNCKIQLKFFYLLLFYFVKITITVKLKDNVEDAEGESVMKALELLGYSGIRSIRTAKVYYIDMENGDYSRGKEFCEKLLANPVINDCRVEINE